MDKLDVFIEEWRKQHKQSMKLNKISLFTAILSIFACTLNVFIQDNAILLIVFTIGSVFSMYLVARAVGRLVELHQRNMEVEWCYLETKMWHSIYSDERNKL